MRAYYTIEASNYRDCNEQTPILGVEIHRIPASSSEEAVRKAASLIRRDHYTVTEIHVMEE